MTDSGAASGLPDPTSQLSQPDQSPEEGPGVLGVISRSAGWNIFGQLTPTVVTIFLTPYILHGLGVTRYGLFVLTGSLVTFLGTFDGGIKGTAQRYFGVYAGANDVRRSTQLLVTLLLLITVLGLLLSTAGWFAAPPIVSVLKMPAHLRPETEFLFRTLGILVTFSFIHNLWVSILQAHQRYAYITKAGFAIYALWTGGLILTVHYHWGLRGIAVVFVAQQIFLALVIIPAALGYLRRSDAGLLPRSEIREFISFAGRVQVSNLSILVNNEFDALLIGAVVSVRSVSYYNAGANFAENIGALTLNALAPAQTALTNTYGDQGAAATLSLFNRLQRTWIIVLTGFCATAAGAAWFAVTAWLGHDFSLAGKVAIIALGAQMLYLYSALLRAYLSVIGRPGLESRFGVVSVIANVALTVPLVFTGVLGVIAATAVGQLVGTLYLLRAVRREVSPDIDNLFRLVPLIPALVSAAVVVGLEIAIRPVVPGGGLGLILSGPPAAVGLVVFALLVFGAHPVWALIVAVVRRLRGAPFEMPQFDLRKP